MIDTGTYAGKPAVFIAPARQPGQVGASAAREGHDLHSLQPGEMVLTFPTDEQAKAVDDALVASPTPSVAALQAEKRVKYDQGALLAAAKKLRRLRIETVGGRKERSARTVGSIIDREGDLKGDDEFVAWVIRNALRYYAEAVISVASKP